MPGLSIAGSDARRDPIAEALHRSFRGRGREFVFVRIGAVRTTSIVPDGETPRYPEFRIASADGYARCLSVSDYSAEEGTPYDPPYEGPTELSVVGFARYYDLDPVNGTGEDFLAMMETNKRYRIRAEISDQSPAGRLSAGQVGRLLTFASELPIEEP